jgi:hypothetical protein
MTDTLAPLVRDLLEWIAARPRTYSDVMDAWRTSCPRLTVWEDANDRGLFSDPQVNTRPGAVGRADAAGPEIFGNEMTFRGERGVQAPSLAQASTPSSLHAST